MAAAKAKGTFISFIDADDAMYPERTAVILDVARQHPQLQLILHTFSTESLLNHHGADIPLDETLVRHGDYLFDLVRMTDSE